MLRRDGHRADDIQNGLGDLPDEFRAAGLMVAGLMVALSAPFGCCGEYMSAATATTSTGSAQRRVLM